MGKLSYKLVLLTVFFIGSFLMIPVPPVHSQECSDPLDLECAPGSTEVTLSGVKRCCVNNFMPYLYNSGGATLLCYLREEGIGYYASFVTSAPVQLNVPKTEEISDGTCYYDANNVLMLEIYDELRIRPMQVLEEEYYGCGGVIEDTNDDGEQDLQDIDFDDRGDTTISGGIDAGFPESSGCPTNTCEAYKGDELLKCCEIGASHPFRWGPCIEVTLNGDCVRHAPIVCEPGGWNDPWSEPDDDDNDSPWFEPDPITRPDCTELCDGDPNFDACKDCCNRGEVWTELGCITPTQEGVVAAVMRIFVGIVTAIAVIRFIQAGLLFNTDDQEKIKEAKSIATSAIIAIIFAAAVPIILNFIGVKIIDIGQIFN